MTNHPDDEDRQPDEAGEREQAGGEQSGRPGGEQSGQPAGGPGQAPGQGGYQPGYWEQQAQRQGQQPPPPQYPPQPGYPPPYPSQPYQYVPDHPRATTTLVLGILGVVICQILGPFAWVMGKRTMDEIDASQGRLGGRGSAQAGYVLGIVGTVLLGLSLIFLLIYVIFAVALIGGGIATS